MAVNTEERHGQESLENHKHMFNQGVNYELYNFLGVHKISKDDESGYVFRVWAPHAKQVWVCGDFNNWNKSHPMILDEKSGIWSIKVKESRENQYYKYLVKQANGREIMKTDPMAQVYEKRPETAAVVKELEPFKWNDGLWRGRQKRMNHFNNPINIYEVHAPSWKEHEDGSLYTFKDLTVELIPYVKKMGYTHIEFMPLMEHPLPASWGYQLTGYFALCSSYGTPDEFKDFVNECHQNNIGVLVDWVPGHFSINDDALAYYDGTPTYEYEDPDRAKNIGWGALNFDLGKPEVQSFLLSSAFYWLNEFHLDGMRVDAVSNMIYLDYDEGPWRPNKYGDTRNLEGYAFLQKFNKVVKFAHPESLIIAEESSSGTQISGTIESGAIGFDYKWNMGWMNDVLEFFEMDPYFRKDNLNLVTFSFMYWQAENFVLPLSHDEVVHGKKSLMHKMWGDRYRQFAQLRTLYTFMMMHPGKKLLFMGGEWGQFLEWKFDHGLEWVDLQDKMNAKMQHFTSVLNHFYKEERPLWELGQQDATLEVIDADNHDDTVLSFIRHGKRKKDFLIVILNFTPVERRNFRIGVPYEGTYTEILNTEMKEFGGTWVEHNADSVSEEVNFKDYEHSITTTVPALGAIILKPKDIKVTRQSSKKHSHKK